MRIITLHEEDLTEEGKENFKKYGVKNLCRLASFKELKPKDIFDAHFIQFIDSLGETHIIKNAGGYTPAQYRTAIAKTKFHYKGNPEQSDVLLKLEEFLREITTKEIEKSKNERNKKSS